MYFTIKRNDTKTALKATLKDATGTPVNLAECTVRFITAKSGKTIIDQNASVLDPNNGVVQYAFQSGDTAEVGNMKAEFEVTYPDGKIETFPSSGYIVLNVEPDLG